MSGPAVLDNTVLTNFALIGRPDLVLATWPTACTSPATTAEYQAGVLAHQLPEAAWQSLPVVSLSPAEIALAERLGNRLGKGERECLAVAALRGGLFVSDDFDARRQAREMNVALSGSIGVLLLSVRQNRIALNEGNDLLSSLVAAGYRSPIRSLDSLLR